MPYQSKHMKKVSPAKRISLLSMFTAIAVTVFIIEAQFPGITPIPGIKLGLSNTITLFVMFLMGPCDALMVLILRIILGSVFSGQFMSFIYSLMGGLLSYLTMLILKRFLQSDQIFVCGIFCAVMHNVGQILTAVVITKTLSIFYYLPILTVSGIVTGLFTGLLTQILIKRLNRMF